MAGAKRSLAAAMIVTAIVPWAASATAAGRPVPAACKLLSKTEIANALGVRPAAIVSFFGEIAPPTQIGPPPPPGTATYCDWLAANGLTMNLMFATFKTGAGALIYFNQTTGAYCPRAERIRLGKAIACGSSGRLVALQGRHLVDIQAQTSLKALETLTTKLFSRAKP
jgi:hypothetical protein